MANKRKLTALALLPLLAAGAFAQTATTDPVGFVSYSFGQGTQLSGVPMVKSPILAGAVAAVGANSVTLAGSGLNVAASLVSTKAYYVEIVKDTPNAGAYVGDRLDLDVAGTIAAADGVLMIRSTTENTLQGTLPAALVGTNLVIREHFTLGDLLTQASGLFLNDDQIFMRRDGLATVTFTYKTSLSSWRVGTQNANGTVIYPGVGFALVRAGATATTGTIVGAVRTNSFVQMLRAGDQVLAEGFPIDAAASPTDSTITPNRLFTNPQGTTFAGGDRMYAYNPSTGVLTTYTYNASLNRWAAGTANGNNLKLFNATKGIYLILNAANPNYLYIRPFSL